MNPQLTTILRCPFCGCALAQQSAVDAHNAVLCCECSTYPVVAGIPVIQQDYKADDAAEHLAAGDAVAALCVMLELDEAAPLPNVDTYRAGLELLGSPDEGPYFLNRFADPTFLVSAAIAHGVGGKVFPAHANTKQIRALDVCGGSGHLTRTLGQAGFASVFLAETDYWKLWLAQKFIAPAANMVCCDANQPLPFARDSFDLAICSDAFHYVWSKRLLAEELQRLAGTVVVTHTHNRLTDNFSAGEPLTPHAYRALFAAREARLFREKPLLNAVIDSKPLDLSILESDEALAAEKSLTLIASTAPEFFGVCEPSAPSASGLPSGVWALNPFYEIVSQDSAQIELRLRFPSENYAAEYAACKRYLAEHLTVARADLQRGASELIAARVLLDLPENFGSCVSF